MRAEGQKINNRRAPKTCSGCYEGWKKTNGCHEKF